MNSETPESATLGTERFGWRLKLPATPLSLDDSRLLEYRCPVERPRLWFSLTVLAIMLAAATWIDDRDVLYGVAGLWVAMIFASLQAVAYNTLRGAEVTPTQFPEIYQMAQELCRRFHAPPTRVFVIRSQRVEIETLGFRAPYVIVLTSLLLDSLDSEQLRYAMGRALGEICFGHSRISILLGGDKDTLPAVFSWIAQIRDLVFASYRRAQTLSADRAGILACRSVRVAIETQARLAVGNNQVREVRGEDLLDQAYKLSQGVDRLQTALITLQSPTPLLLHRLQAMVEWAGLPLREPGDGVNS